MPCRLVFVFLLMIAAAVGQNGSKKTFEVASIKPSPPITGDFAAGFAQLSSKGIKTDPALAYFTRVSLTALIARAYKLEGFQVTGPGWMSTSDFDIVAKLPRGELTDSIPEMLRNLLIDRFGLKVHLVTKTYQIFSMNVKSGGLKLPPMTPEREADVASGALPQTMEQCARVLSRVLGRPVLNQTRENGTYVLPRELFKALTLRALWQMQGATPELEEAMSAPSEKEILKALDAAGLLLELRKVPLTELIVDHVDKEPTEN